MTEHSDNIPQGPVEYDQTRIPEPVSVEPGYVGATYTFPDGITPDSEKNHDTSYRLQQRIKPTAGPKTRVALVETGRQFTTRTREWDGVTTREVTHKEVVEGEYKVSRKRSAAVILGTFLLFNVLGNLPAIEGVVKRVVYDAQDHTRLKIRPVPVRTQGAPRKITRIVYASSAAGQATVDRSAITSFVQQVHRAERDGAVVNEVGVAAFSSDEDNRYPHSIGHPTKTNQQLASGREKTAIDDLESAGFSVPKDQIRQSAHEIIITNKTLHKMLSKEARQEGFSNLQSAVAAAIAGDKLDPSLARGIAKHFTGVKDRGVELSAKLDYPGNITITNELEPILVSDGTTPPHIPGFKFWGFIPLLPWRRRKQVKQTEPVLAWVAKKHDIFMPQLLREKQDKTWLQVFEDGVEADGSLKPGAFWHTDKGEYLLREENRLQDMLRVDLHDADGKPQTMRMLFVDNKPGENERIAFQNELVRAAQFDNGKLAEVADTIVVYPSESAGTKHQDPSRVALGPYRQLSGNILAVYTPALKLIEVVMPADSSPEELQQLFESFYGPTGVLRHEFGHAVGRKDETYAVRETKATGPERTYVLQVVGRSDDMETTLKGLKSLNPNDPNLQFDVRYRTLDMDDQEAAIIEDRVTPASKQLAHAEHVQIVDRQVLPRAHRLRRHRRAARRRLAAEEFADSFAALADKGVPFRAAGIKVPKTELKRGGAGKFSRWFLPTTQVQSLIERQAVAEPGVVPLKPTYSTEVTVTHLDPRKDPLVGTHMTRARQAHSRDGRQYVIYLTDVNYAERQGNEEASDD